MNLDLFNIEGKVAWVTGGTKGLGLQMAHTLARLGARVVVNSRHGAEAQAAAEEVADRHDVQTLGVEADVTDESAIADLVQQTSDTLGPVAILITNAGVNVRTPTVDLDLADWQRVIAINLTGPFLCSKAVLPGMIEAGWGRVIHVSSILGHVGLADRPPYTASKGGLLQLARTQALEVATTGVTVNALCPGPFGTEMNRPLLDDPEAYAAFVEKIPMGRWGEMHELDGAVAFLASPSSDYMTGASLTIDGGWTAQ